MKENKNNRNNNNVHLYGLITDVRSMNTFEDGNTAINLTVSTREWNDRDKKFQYTNHDARVVTKDPDLIAAFQEVAAKTEANKANKGVEGFEPEYQKISASGYLVAREKATGNGEKYDTFQVRLNPETIDLNAPRVKYTDEQKAEAKKGGETLKDEPQNTATIVGNIGSINVKDKVADFSIGHSFDVKGADGQSERKTTWIRAEAFANGRGKELYAFLADTAKAKEAAQAAGEEFKMPFIRVKGQIHENNFGEGDDKRFMYRLTATKHEKLEKKQGEAEAVTVVTEPQGKEKAAKATVNAKPATGKKAAQDAAPKVEQPKPTRKPGRKL